MRRRPFVLSLVAIGLVAAGPLQPAAAGRGHLDLTGLEPGEEVVYTTRVPVNLVLLGAGDLDHDEITAELPATYEPVAREPASRGIESRPIGLRYELDYRLVEAGRPLADRFFEFVARTGQVGDRTADQQRYNAQDGNRLEVDDQVLYIDAPAAERWLNTRGRGSLGIDRDAYTVYFVNWYGRADFRFHVYTKDIGIDPDTGVAHEPRELAAWGGTDGRSWFFDLSAGPNPYGGSWNVDDADLDGDGEEDYRIPVAWEYHPDGFRDPGRLSSDLGKVTRFVAINQLFTPSPTYDPMVATPQPGGTKVVHLHVLQELPGGDGIDLIQPSIVGDRLAGLQPYHDWQVHLSQTNPLDAGAQHTLEVWSVFWREGVFPDDPGCWEPFGHPAAQLFCFFEANRDRYFPAYGDADYLIPTVLIDIRDELLSINGGIADHNWRDRTQSYVYVSSSPGARVAEGKAFTSYGLHEIGHHIGLPHPYDGWDSEQELNYFASGDLYFVDLGTQVHSGMGDVATLDFSQFEDDNLARWDIAGHLNAANALAELVLDHPQADQVRWLVKLADHQAAMAQRRLASWNYHAAARAAHRSLGYLVDAAERLGIDPVPQR